MASVNETTEIWLTRIAVVLWLVFLGPLWLLGWGVLHSTKWLNKAASFVCRALLVLLP